jgi:hypothetical protein
MDVVALDVVGFLNRVTGNHLLLWKTIAATVVFALAGLQVMLAARFWEVTGFPPVSAAAAARVHRFSGRLAITLALLVAFACIVGPAGPLSPTRVALHSIFGILLFIVLAVKFALLKLIRNGERLVPWAGISLFFLFGAIWATSVADYVSAR